MANVEAITVLVPGDGGPTPLTLHRFVKDGEVFIARKEYMRDQLWCNAASTLRQQLDSLADKARLAARARRLAGAVHTLVWAPEARLRRRTRG